MRIHVQLIATAGAAATAIDATLSLPQWNNGNALTNELIGTGDADDADPTHYESSAWLSEARYNQLSAFLAGSGLVQGTHYWLTDLIRSGREDEIAAMSLRRKPAPEAV